MQVLRFVGIHAQAQAVLVVESRYLLHSSITCFCLVKWFSYDKNRTNHIVIDDTNSTICQYIY
jgi:hypothetical protein